MTDNHEVGSAVLGRVNRVRADGDSREQLLRVARKLGLTEQLVADVLTEAATDPGASGWLLLGGRARRIREYDLTSFDEETVEHTVWTFGPLNDEDE